MAGGVLESTLHVNETTSTVVIFAGTVARAGMKMLRTRVILEIIAVCDRHGTLRRVTMAMHDPERE